jgi:hypothetical protein
LSGKERKKRRSWRKCAIATRWENVKQPRPVKLIEIDGWFSYQSSFGFARRQILYRSQGTLLPLSVRTQGIESVEQCATQGFNLVKQGNSFFWKSKLHLI